MINQKTLPGSPGQVNFPARHVTLKAYITCPMGKSPDKSHPLTKLLTKKSKKWPWARKLWKVLAQRTSLNSIFFSSPVYKLLSSFYKKKIEFCQDDINFMKQRDF